GRRKCPAARRWHRSRSRRTAALRRTRPPRSGPLPTTASYRLSVSPLGTQPAGRTLMSDTTKIIPPPRHGPRWIDLILAAVAGGLVTLLLIGVALGGGLSRFAGASASPSPSASVSVSPTTTTQIRTAAPTTEAPSPAP